MVIGRIGGGNRLSVAPCSALESVARNGGYFHRADARLVAHGAGNQAAATQSAGGGTASGVWRMPGWRMAFLGGGTVSAGDEITLRPLRPKALLKKEHGVLVYQGEPCDASITDLIDRNRESRIG